MVEIRCLKCILLIQNHLKFNKPKISIRFLGLNQSRFMYHFNALNTNVDKTSEIVMREQYVMFDAPDSRLQTIVMEKN